MNGWGAGIRVGPLGAVAGGAIESTHLRDVYRFDMREAGFRDGGLEAGDALSVRGGVRGSG